MNDILLVDDEQAVLQSLSSSLDWAEYGFGSVHLASSARDAMRILKEHLIDLMILDIQMPEMNGLEMLKLVRKKYPDIHCILISAYSKFDYAREALRLNVENYLLKPIDINELRETIIHAAENIAKASASSHNLFERNLLERWLYGRITHDELVEHSQYTDYNVLLRHYYAVILRQKNGIAVPLHSMAAMLSHDITAYPLNKDEQTGILLCGGHDISEAYIEEAALSLAAVYPGIQIMCGSRATGSGNVSKSLADADHTLEYARLAGCTGYLSFHRINWNPFSPAQLEGLNDILQQAAPQKQILDFAAYLADSTECNGDYRGLYAHICLTLMHLLEDLSQKNLSLLPMSPPYTRERFLQAVGQAVLSFGSSQQYAQELSPIVQRMIQYIRENLSGSISIKQFCEQTNMNPTYLGRLFKEELGMYFSEYVCTLRINKAKFLLKSTTSPVNDIARQVGIYDVSYFVQCFKKQERISPMKYRQAVLQEKTYSDLM